MMYFIRCTTKAQLGGGLQKWANQNTEPANSWSDRVIQKKGEMSYTHSLLIIWLEYLSGIRFQWCLVKAYKCKVKLTAKNMETGNRGRGAEIHVPIWSLAHEHIDTSA